MFLPSSVENKSSPSRLAAAAIKSTGLAGFCERDSCELDLGSLGFLTLGAAGVLGTFSLTTLGFFGGLLAADCFLAAFLDLVRDRLRPSLSPSEAS